MAKGKTGRPTAYKADYARMARVLCEKGATDADMADVFAVSEQTINTWKKRHPDFLESMQAGKGLADDKVERALYERALGYSHPDTHISSYQGDVTETPIVKHYPPEVNACRYWLNNRRPKEWRERREIVGEGGGPVGLVIKRYGEGDDSAKSEG